MPGSEGGSPDAPSRGMGDRSGSSQRSLSQMGLSMADDEHVLDLKDLHCDEKNLVMFRRKHLFVEMHELNEKDKAWHETHRWNYGLEEELVPPKSETEDSKWTQAHLPTISVFGMMALRECLKTEYIYLDIQPEQIWDETETDDATAVFSHTLRLIAIKIVNRCVKDGIVEPGHANSALDILWTHLDCKKCIDHDLSLMKERALAISNSRRGRNETSPRPRARTSTAAPAMRPLRSQASKPHGSFQRFASLLKPRLSNARLVVDDDGTSSKLDTTTHDDGTSTLSAEVSNQEDGKNTNQIIDTMTAPTSLTSPINTPKSPLALRSGHNALSETGTPEAPEQRHVMIAEEPRRAQPEGKTQKNNRGFQSSKSEGNLYRRGSFSEGNIAKALPPTKPKKKRSTALQMAISTKKFFQHDDQTDDHTNEAGGHGHHDQDLYIKIKEDPLRPDAEEEAVHILIDDQFNELKSDVVVLVRLQAPVISGLEERANSDDIPSDTEEHSPRQQQSESTSHEFKHEDKSHTTQDIMARTASTPYMSGEKAGMLPQKKKKHSQQDLMARFVVLVLGPRHDKKADSAVKKAHTKNIVSKQVPELYRRRHKEMGAAVAALMQDDAVVRALYEAKKPSQILEAIDLKLSAMRILPRTSRPTKAAVKHRASNMYKQLAEIRRVAEEQAKAHELQLLQQGGDMTPTAQLVEFNYTGGRFIRLEYPDQGAKWGAREKDSFTAGFSISAVLNFIRKYALPLMAGIVLALILANFRAGGYRRWAGVHEHHDDDHDDEHHDYTDEEDHRLLSGGGGGVGHPTVFGLEINDHPLTIHFLVNDVFMAFFFGLAVKEIAEAFQPGGSLYPPTVKAVNPMLGTLGAVLGPILFYFLFCLIAVQTGIVSRFNFGELAEGWGVPTATDISVAWVTAVVVFGSGHPAINYLLLCAVIDDGIGLLIIAVFYPDPDNPLKPVWLLLVVLAMFVSYALRKLNVARWQVYVFLAGPIAWFGLIYAAIHPSLALCFVVPFMPIKIEHATDDLKDRLNAAANDGHVMDAHHRGSPLHDFEEGVKDFVDFFVLFAFAAVNAGVVFEDAGPFSAVVFLSLVVGKTIGLTLGSQIGVWLGFPRPPGMSFQHLVIAGVICSVGLTVALFIAGEAFADEEVLEGQAKLGALLSLVPALILVAVANFSQSARRLLVGPSPQAAKTTHFDPMLMADLANPPNHDDPEASSDIAISSGLSGDGIAASPTNKDQKDFIDYTIDYDDTEDKDEFLEDVVVSNIEASLQEIHQIQTQVEQKAGLRRSSQMIEGVRRAHQSPY